MAFRLQEVIHKFEEGSGARSLKVALGLIVVIGLAAIYDVTAYKNLATKEAMDAAQLARNIADGRGFTTDFIRPFGLYLLHSVRSADQDPAAPGDDRSTNAVPASALQTNTPVSLPLPDISNPPLYPVLLAGVLKLVPASTSKRGPAGEFSVSLPDLCIAFFNQTLFLLAAGLVYFLGRRLFDEAVGLVSTAVFIGADLFWQLSVSGLPTMLLTVIFLAIVLVLALLEPAAREGKRSRRWLLSMAALAGILVGLGGLTRYGFLWTMIPVVLFLISLPGGKSTSLAALAVAAAVVVVAPWLGRNIFLSGVPFGTATYAVMRNTGPFPDDQLERSLHPELGGMRMTDFKHKLLANAKEIVTKDLPSLGGSWVSMFFLAGLLVPFRSPTLRALRGFALYSLALFVVVQALGRTSAPDPAGSADPDNLLVVIAPLVFLFGVSLFFILLDQSRLSLPPGRYAAVGGFWCLMSLPLLLTLLSPVRSALAYPPYYPPWIEEKSARVDRDEVIMSDIPWAVAWYGHRPSVWLSLIYQNAPEARVREDFAAMNRTLPLHALYLSAKQLPTILSEDLLEWRISDRDMDLFIGLRQRLIESWRVGGDETRERDFQLLSAFRTGLYENQAAEQTEERNWGSFVVGTLIKQEVPAGFPLQRAYERLLPEIFLTDSERKKEKAIQSE